MLALSAEDLRALVPMRDAIAAVRDAFVALSSGRAVIPIRTAVAVPGDDAVFLSMPGVLGGGSAAAGGSETAAQAAVVGAKLVSVFPQNRATGAAVIQAVVLLFDGADGRPLALMDGGVLTAVRTGAATGAATDLLARPDACILTLFGAGVQARSQLEAVCAVRPVTQIRIVGRTPGRMAAFAAWAREQAWVRGATILTVTDPELAVRGAEIIVTATTSPIPVFPGRVVAAGAHVNAIGAFRPTARELDSDLVGRAAVFVDSRAGALKEAGDLLIPMREGVFTVAGVRAEIGEVASGHSGRRTMEEITLFKSVGNAVQDLAVAALAVRRAEATGRGLQVDLDGRRR